MFNPDTKEKFLQTIKAESTCKMARYTLESISKYEENANKELFCSYERGILCDRTSS